MDGFTYSDVAVTLSPDEDDPYCVETVQLEGAVTLTIESENQFRVTKPWVAGLAPGKFEKPYVRIEGDIEADPDAAGRAVVGLVSTFDGPEVVLELADILDALCDGTLVPDEKRYARYNSF
jgi:hypothetical protein